MTAIQVRELRKSYHGVTAVGGLDLDIESGEVFALLGPNGAGKTTTVEILEGFRHRDAGEVTVLGGDPGSPDALWRSRIGIVLQYAGGHGEFTVGELVRHFAGYYPAARDPQEVIAAVGLGAKEGTRAMYLSGGQRRRLDVALGVLGRPELLFLDEPTTGFDPEARREFWTLIESLVADGTTIVLTTHYLEEAEHLADRVGIIAGGRLVAVDSPARLGGRGDQQAHVRWLEGDEPQSTTTEEATTVVRQLAERFDGEIPGLQVLRPTLEESYVRLIAESGMEAS